MEMEIHGILGESLGSIGGHQPPVSSSTTTQEDSRPVPEWKKALLSRPSISTRKGMAWEFEDPFEDTDTLVLTSGEGWFVDVRFSLSGDGWDDGGGIWAFAGRGWIRFAADTGGR